MKKIIAIGLAVMIVVGLCAIPVMAAPAGKDIKANENMQNLYLYEKDADADWAIVWDGAWGKYNYKLSGTGAETAVSGVFNGKGLDAGVDYSLIYYPETRTTWPWPVVVIGSDTANTGGNVHITGTAIIGIPDSHDDPLDIDYYPDDFGDKIWLVLSTDIVSGSISGWNPGEYLFENKLINTP